MAQEMLNGTRVEISGLSLAFYENFMLKKLLKAHFVLLYIILYLAVGVLGTVDEYCVSPENSARTCKHVKLAQNDVDVDDTCSHVGISGDSHNTDDKKISFTAVEGLPHPFLYAPSFTTTKVTRQHLAFLFDPRISLLASRAPPA